MGIKKRKSKRSGNTYISRVWWYLLVIGFSDDTKICWRRWARFLASIFAITSRSLTASMIISTASAIGHKFPSSPLFGLVVYRAFSIEHTMIDFRGIRVGILITRSKAQNDSIEISSSLHCRVQLTVEIRYNVCSTSWLIRDQRTVRVMIIVRR